MMFRLQSKRPARHDMLNSDAVILHHNAFEFIPLYGMMRL
jgi:hypothetical protein